MFDRVYHVTRQPMIDPDSSSLVPQGRPSVRFVLHHNGASFHWSDHHRYEHAKFMCDKRRVVLIHFVCSCNSGPLQCLLKGAWFRSCVACSSFFVCLSLLVLLLVFLLLVAFQHNFYLFHLFSVLRLSLDHLFPLCSVLVQMALVPDISWTPIALAVFLRFMLGGFWFSPSGFGKYWVAAQIVSGSRYPFLVLFSCFPSNCNAVVHTGR